MPAIMNLCDPMEIVVTQDTTYILISHVNDSYRRIYTDGRDWPAEGECEPSYAGYSIGKWLDTTGSGHYDVLEVETGHFRGPRAFESTGLPPHRDNQNTSGSASISTKPTATSSTTTLRCSIMP
jgi:hypothetical protein